MIIKVRGWHFKQRRMYSAEEMAKDQLALLPTGYFANISGTSTALTQIASHDIMLPLLYTGLHSTKLIQEIYEGDIILLDSTAIGCEKVIGEVQWNSDGTLDGLCFGLWTSKGWYHTDFMGGIELLGNIYENPELSYHIS